MRLAAPLLALASRAARPRTARSERPRASLPISCAALQTLQDEIARGQHAKPISRKER